MDRDKTEPGNIEGSVYNLINVVLNIDNSNVNISNIQIQLESLKIIFYMASFGKLKIYFFK